MISFKSKASLGALVVSIYLGIFALFYFWQTPINYLIEVTKGGGVVAPLAFTLMAFLAVVVAPLTIIPFIPVASVIFGPFWAGVYSILGWFLGSVVDFVIAREFGRPLLKRFVSLKEVERYESYIPHEMEFWWIVLLRMIVPVDALSYALGLFSRVKLWKYSLATLFSIMPFAFVASYAGGALQTRNFKLFIILGILFIIVFTFLSWIFYKKGGVKDEIKEEIKDEKK